MPRGDLSRRKLIAPCCSAAVLIAILALAGCTSTLSSLPPALGGLPDDTPARPSSGEQLAYPAVHDMPPPRQTRALSPSEVSRAEAEMARMRDRQGGKQTVDPKPKQQERAQE